MNTVLDQTLTLDAALKQAVAHHQSGQLQDAERLYRAILQAQPSHPDANHNLGVLAVQVKQPTAGLPHFKAALVANPDQRQYWLSYIDALIQSGQHDAARQVLEQGRQRGLQGEAVTALAERVAGGGQLSGQINSAAWQALEDAASISSVYLKNNKKKHKGKPAKHKSAQKRAVRQKINPSPQELNTLEALFTEGRYTEAANLAQGMTEHYPSHGFSWKVLGVVFKLMGREVDALAPMQRAAALSPDDAAAHNNLGALLKDMGRLDEAVANCQRAIEIEQDFAEAYCNLANALKELGHLDEAAANYRRALEYKPNWAPLYFNLHPLLLNPEDMTPSIQCLEKALEIDPANAEYRFFLGMMLEYSGDSEAAAEHFDRVEESANRYRARLDAWRYLKSANATLPIITGSNIGAFKIGMASALNDGLIMEFGVRFGSSIRQIAALVDQEVHGFDSFEGLPEQWHHEPKGSYTTKGIIPNVPDNVSLYAGWFEDTLPEFLKSHIGPVRFMNIDCDIYSSTKTVLDLLSERIIPGTVIVFDEYIGNENWREDEFKAFQEAVVKYNWGYEYISFSFVTKQVVVRIVYAPGKSKRVNGQHESQL